MRSGAPDSPGRIRRFAALPPAERRLWLEAWWTLLAADLRLRWAPRRALERALAGGARGDSIGTLAPDLARVVASAAAHHLWEMHCLPRSLALCRMLARRDVQARLRIGVRRDSKSLAAHAWVEVDDDPVGEPVQIETRFLPLLPPPRSGST